MFVKNLTRSFVFAFAALWFTSAIATPLGETIRVEMNFYRQKTDLSYKNPIPPKAPGQNECPVTVGYNSSANTFYLVAEDECTVDYTIYDEMGSQLQTGTISVIAGQASIPVTGVNLTDGCMIELTIGDTTFLGTVEL